MKFHLDTEFKDAFDKVSNSTKKLAPDTMLQLYAYYKQANFGNNIPFENIHNVRNAFKFNAWMQLNGMSPDDAKKKYIKLANTILNLKK